MGVNLILCKKDGEYVADLGRSYHYQNFDGELDIDYDKLDINREAFIDSIRNKISDILFFYVGQNSELSFNDVQSEVEEILIENIDPELYGMAEELENIGKKKLLAYILEEDHLTYRVE